MLGKKHSLLLVVECCLVLQLRNYAHFQHLIRRPLSSTSLILGNREHTLWVLWLWCWRHHTDSCHPVLFYVSYPRTGASNCVYVLSHCWTADAPCDVLVWWLDSEIRSRSSALCHFLFDVFDDSLVRCEFCPASLSPLMSCGFWAWFCTSGSPGLPSPPTWSRALSGTPCPQLRGLAHWPEAEVQAGTILPSEDLTPTLLFLPPLMEHSLGEYPTASCWDSHHCHTVICALILGSPTCAQGSPLLLHAFPPGHGQRRGQLWDSSTGQGHRLQDLHTRVHVCARMWYMLLRKEPLDKTVYLKTLKNFSVDIMKLTQKKGPATCWLVFGFCDD